MFRVKASEEAKRSSLAEWVLQGALVLALLASLGSASMILSEHRLLGTWLGDQESMRRTLRAIGLRHHQQEVVKPDTPSLRGQLKQVRHLVEVTPVEE